MTTLLEGDNRQVLLTLPDNSVDSIVTDPPYELGFMGKSWDSTGIAYDPIVWTQCLRVLKPGGHLLSFGGTRTYHRMVCAIEDAGFEIRDEVLWIYGSGFPKSLDISKAIDKAAPREGMFLPFACHYAERRAASGLTHAAICEAGKFYDEQNHGGASVNWEKGYNVPTFAQWRILQSLLGLCPEWLPLIERVEAEREVVGRYEATDNTPRFVGIYTDGGLRAHDITAPSTPAAQLWQGWGTALKPAHEPICLARKPIEGTVANNALKWGVGGLNIDGGRIDYQSEADKFGNGFCRVPTNGRQFADGASGFANGRVRVPQSGRWPANVIADGSAEVVKMFPQAKVGGKRAEYSTAGRAGLYAQGGRSLVGYDDDGSACRFFYSAKASGEDRNEGMDNDKNGHPTVKPVDLMCYLCRLITPKGGVVLDPFMGSGSTGKAAQMEGFNFIGIELDSEYMKIAKARIGYADNLFTPKEMSDD